VLVTNRRENPVQVVLAVPQVASRTHAGLHLLTSVTDVPARCALLQLCRAADASMKRRPRTTSVKQAADTAEAAAIDRLLPSPTEYILVIPRRRLHRRRGTERSVASVCLSVCLFVGDLEVKRLELSISNSVDLQDLGVH